VKLGCSLSWVLQIINLIAPATSSTEDQFGGCAQALFADVFRDANENDVLGQGRSTKRDYQAVQKTIDDQILIAGFAAWRNDGSTNRILVKTCSQ
jgi:hypothetical protein